MMKALVVFSDNTGLWWLKLLKSGFRHCFMILETDRGYVWLDPLSQRFTVRLLDGMEYDGLKEWYENQGMKVIPVLVNEQGNRPFPWGVMSCVEVIKRVIGVRQGMIFTPWQLYQYLKRTNSENL